MSSDQPTSASPVVELKNLELQRGSETVLKIPSLRLESGTQTLLMGGSGTGKSSLIHLLAGFLAPTSGNYWFEGREVGGLRETQWDRLRAGRIGVVFQQELMGELPFEGVVVTDQQQSASGLSHELFE